MIFTVLKEIIYLYSNSNFFGKIAYLIFFLHRVDFIQMTVNTSKTLMVELVSTNG